MILFTGQKHAHSNTSNVHDERKMRRVDTSKKYGCVCTCCQRKNLMRCDCIIFVKRTMTQITQILLMHYQTGTEKWEIKNSYANHVIQDYKTNMTTHRTQIV